MKEQWKDIEGFEDLYQVSNLGNVKSLPREKQNIKGSFITKEKLLKPRKTGDGYVAVILWNKDYKKTYSIHRLVATAFLDNPNNYPEVNHKDENKENNSVENLEWCDHLYNMRYGTWHEARINKTKKPVLQFDKHNKLIKKWESGTEAAKTLNINQSEISRCCRGQIQQHRGFIWRYADTTGEIIL